MRRIRDCLRLYYENNLSQSQISRSLGISRSTVQDYLSRMTIASLTYDAIRTMSDSDLERALYKQKDEIATSSSQNDLDYSYIHKELSKTGVTLRLLWEEYKKSQPDGYQYSHYCWLYQQWRGTLKIYMRQHHIAGERVYVDYSGKKPSIVNRFTGEITEVELFVMCWGYSHYTYAEAQPSQKQEHWITGHINGLNFFGCVPQIITPDNYKGAVIKAHRYDPDINHAYTELSEHYGFGVIPARSNSPKDKAKVECGVLIVQRWILARLRHQVFHNITELNIAVKTLLSDLNNRKMQRLNKTRKELFEEVDKPNARPLPSTPFSYRKHFGATVNLDYHVEIEKKYYSVPWQYCRKKVHCYVENEVVSIFYQEHRIAVHNELSKEHTFSTLTEHMPQQHRAVADWSVAFVLRKAKECGPSTEQLIRKVVAEKQHPQQGFRPSQGILRLADNYGKERLEAAAAIALQMGLTRVQQITNLLKNNKDIVTEQSTQTVENTSNIRGQNYYAQEEGTK